MEISKYNYELSKAAKDAKKKQRENMCGGVVDGVAWQSVSDCARDGRLWPLGRASIALFLGPSSGLT